MIFEQPADTDTSMHEKSAPEGERLTSWIDWYRFARRTLELGHPEAAAYATARFVEEQNRSAVRERRGDSALSA